MLEVVIKAVLKDQYQENSSEEELLHYTLETLQQQEEETAVFKSKVHEAESLQNRVAELEGRLASNRNLPFEVAGKS